jgi:hypothetical protein
MKRVVLSVLLVLVSIAAVYDGSEVAERAVEERDALAHQVKVAIAHMDRGAHSLEYRGAIGFLRAHAAEATVWIEDALRADASSFRSWQLSFLIAEFGEGRALDVLRELVRRPLPEPRPSLRREHAIDVRYTEALATRMQAVSSIARIGLRRPELRDDAVETLAQIADEVPLAKAAALFELETLNGEHGS